MAITTLQNTGFEYGSTSILGGGLLDGLGGSGVTVVTANKRNGAYCLHLVYPGSNRCSVGKAAGSASTLVMRFAVRISALPASASMIAYGGTSNYVTNDRFQITVDNTGTLRAVCGAGSAAVGPTISSANWLNYHLIELQATWATGSWTLDWKVDGVSQTQATGGVGSAGTIFGVCLGSSSASAPTLTADFDDWIFGTWTVAGTDWYGDGKGLAYLPAADGTHSNSGDFSPGDAGTQFVSPPTNAYTYVDDAGGTTKWTGATHDATNSLAQRATTHTSSAWLEFVPATPAETGQANAVRALLAYSSGSTTANNGGCEIRNSAAAVVALYGTVAAPVDWSDATVNWYKSANPTKPVAGWTVTEIAALRWRFGGSTDVAPVPSLQALMLEVDWPVSSVVPAALTLAASAGQSATVLVPTPYLGTLASAGQSAATGVVSAPIPIPLATSAGQSGATMVLAPLIIGATSGGQSTATATIATKQPVPLGASAAQSGSSLTLAYYLGVLASQGQAGATLVLAAYLGALSAGTQSTVSALGLFVPTPATLGALSSTGQSSAQATVSAPATLTLSVATGTAGATLTPTYYLGALRSDAQTTASPLGISVPGPAYLGLTSSGQSSSAATVATPQPISGTAGGTANATLNLAIAPQLAPASSQAQSGGSLQLVGYLGTLASQAQSTPTLGLTTPQPVLFSLTSIATSSSQAIVATPQPITLNPSVAIANTTFALTISPVLTLTSDATTTATLDLLLAVPSQLPLNSSNATSSTALTDLYSGLRVWPQTTDTDWTGTTDTTWELTASRDWDAASRESWPQTTDSGWVRRR